MTKYQEIQLTETYPFITLVLNGKYVTWKITDTLEGTQYAFYCNANTNSLDNALIKFEEWKAEDFKTINK